MKIFNSTKMLDFTEHHVPAAENDRLAILALSHIYYIFNKNELLPRGLSKSLYLLESWFFSLRNEKPGLLQQFPVPTAYLRGTAVGCLAHRSLGGFLV